jgi:primosomal protein N'
MKLIKIISQNRRDFTGLYECEACGHRLEKSGYDDRYYHDVVEPQMKCPKCWESTMELGLVPQRIATKYAESETV